MDAEILEFISEKRVCVLAVEMPDGAPHAATVNFAHTDDPLIFIIQTSPKSLKAQALMANEETRVSIVVGLEESPDGKDVTFQLDGVAQEVKSDSNLADIYLDKYPEKKGKWHDDIFLSVEPVWWRYTSWVKSGTNPHVIQMV